MTVLMSSTREVGVVLAILTSPFIKVIIKISLKFSSLVGTGGFM